MASSSADGGQPPPGHVTSYSSNNPYSSAATAAPPTSSRRVPTSQATSQKTPQATSQTPSKANIHSYNSFKKIIEGHTYHPSTSHSRESSQASTGSDVIRTDTDPAHARTSSRESACSRGREYKRSNEEYSPQGYAQGHPRERKSKANNFDEVDNGRHHRHSPSKYDACQQPQVHRPRSDYIQDPFYETDPQYPHGVYPPKHHKQGQAYRQLDGTDSFTDFNSNRNYNDEDSDPKRNRRRLNPSHPSDTHGHNAPPNYNPPPKYKSNRCLNEQEEASSQPHPANRNSRADYTGSANAMSGFDQPHPANRSSRAVEYTGAANLMSGVDYRRPGPDSSPDRSQRSGVSRSNNDLRPDLRPPDHPPPRSDVSPGRSRPRLQRQVGVHVKDDVTLTPQASSRPMSEFLDRSHLHETPVLYREGERKQRKGYVNSAYIEDGYGSAPNLETVSESNTTADGGRTRHTDPPMVRGQRVLNGVNREAASNGDVANVSARPLAQKHPLKKTVNEAIRERDDQVMLRRQYVQQKHRSLNNNDLPCDNDVDIHLPRTKDNQKRPKSAMVQRQKSGGVQQSEKSTMVHQRPKSSGVQQSENRRSRALDRPLSPHKKDLQRRFTFGQSVLRYKAAQPPEVGLQKFVRCDSSTKGGAVMVHTAPSSGKTRNHSGGQTSPVIINVGEMTWQRLKRQVSKKNVYVVQQEAGDEEKTTKGTSGPARPPKARTHFTLSLFTLCFCLSPLGFVAMIFAVCSASAFKDRDSQLGRRLSKVALVLSVVGILSTIAITAILIGTNTIPVMGRYGEPEGN